MPAVKRISKEEAAASRTYEEGTILTYDDLPFVKDIWMDKSGKMYYAGYYGHEACAKALGFDGVDAAENAGYVHISSAFRSTPNFVHIPRRPTKAQKESSYDFCMAHNMTVPNLLQLD